MTIAENLRAVRSRIAAACARVGRDPAEIELVAVTKTVGPGEIRELAGAGHLVVGENRPQALRDKVRALTDLPLNWHFIGTLQSNKIKYVFPVAEMIHSVDRVDLLEELAGWAGKTGRRCPCLLEVHIAAEEQTKQGFAPDEVLPVLDRFRTRPDLDIRGLMGMAPFVSEERPVRAAFRLLADLRLASRDLEGPAYRAEHLSMGMTDDFPIAIEEGATIIRIGRALFADEPVERTP
jgi:PLP dependent protein